MTVGLLLCRALVATYEKSRAPTTSGDQRQRVREDRTRFTVPCCPLVCTLHVIRWCSILAGRIRITTSVWRIGGDRTLPLLPHSMAKVELEGGEQTFARFPLSTRAIGAGSLVSRWYYLRLKTA
jgi:hypothetical protein